MKTNPFALVAAFSLAVAGLNSGCQSSSGGYGGLSSPELVLTDYKQAALEIAGELVVHPSIAKFEAQNGAKPRLDIGRIRVATKNPVSVHQFAERVMEVLLDSGQITLVAHDEAAVKANGLENFLKDSKITLSDQADFYLEGAIDQSNLRGGGKIETTYSFFLRLNDRNRSQIWKRTHDIEKHGVTNNRRGGVGLF